MATTTATTTATSLCTDRSCGHGLQCRQPGLPLPRHDPRELRSYRFFLQVTALSFAGGFDIDLWLHEIPRACHADAALWHAVVSLGAIHEYYSSAASSPSPASNDARRQASVFALREFNLAIRHLVRTRTHLGPIPEKWRALIASVIFTCICSIQGLHNQALIHLSASRKLLLELEEESRTREARSGPVSRQSPPQSPVSLSSLHTIVASFDAQARALESGGLKDEQALLVDSEVYSDWRLYHSPTSIPLASSSSLDRCHRCQALDLATPGNLARAGRALESLLNHMIVWTQQNASGSAAILMGKADASMLQKLVAGQQAYVRAFRQLATTVSRLKPAAERDCLCPAKKADPELRTKRKAILTLCLFQATCRLLFLCDPGIEPEHEGYSSASPSRTSEPLDPESHFSHIVDLAESILTNGVGGNDRTDENNKTESPASCTSSRRVSTPESFTPSSSTTQPLSVVAHSSSSPTLRHRVIDLLRRYPRRDGLWDSIFAARMWELVLAREEAAVAAAAAADVKEFNPVLAKGHDMRVEFVAEREARVVFRSWGEWIAGEAGEETTLRW